jgi:hypothetical protein
MALSQQQIDEFEAQHKRIAHLRGKDDTWEVVFRKPTRAEYRRFKSQINDPTQQSDAAEQLARQLVVYPSREAFDALLEDWPAIPEAASKAFLALSGMNTEADGK